MTDQLKAPDLTVAPATILDRAISTRLGYWSALLTSLLTLLTFGIAVFTLPITGPLCQTDCITYPFAEIAARVPRDYYWMYPAIPLFLTFTVAVIALHNCTPDRRRVFSQVALTFTAIAATLLVANYYIQIATLQPSTLRGESDGVALLTQYNPHGVFIALEDLGYFVLALVFIFASRIFDGSGTLERGLRWLLLIGGLVTVAAWFGMYAVYGYGLEYRFEVTAISIDYLVLLIAGVLLSLWFRRTNQSVA